MRVLGIDPGSQYMGLACVEKTGAYLACVGFRLVAVRGSDPNDWAARLRSIYQSITEQIEIWRPDCAAVENVFMNKNANSALKLGQARGAAMTAVAMMGLALSEYSPRTIKQNLTASGGADKQQVEKMVRLLLGKSLAKFGEIPRSDVADAMAVAICHAQQNALIKAGRQPLRVAVRDWK